MSRRGHALVFVAAALAGCDPGYHISGQVVDARHAAIATAKATMACPDRKQPNQQAVDANGAFSFGGVGALRPEVAAGCMITVEAPGFVARAIAIAETCYRNTLDDAARKGDCMPDEGVVTLARAP